MSLPQMGKITLDISPFNKDFQVHPLYPSFLVPCYGDNN